VANELSYLNKERFRHISSLENPEEHPDPLVTRRGGGGERTSYGGGGVQNMGYKSPVLFPVSCIR